MFGKSRVRHVVMAAAAIVGGAFVASSAFLADTAGAAAPKTVTVTFGQNGPTPATVQLQAGDSVKFVNQVPQTGSLALPAVTAQIQSAAVAIHGVLAATEPDIQLPAFNSSASVRYPSAGTVKFRATYTYRLVPLLNALGINLVPATAQQTHDGTLAIAAAPASGSGGGSGGGGGGGGVQPGAPAGGGQSGGGAQVPNAGSGVGTPLPQGGNSVNGGGTGYTPQGPSVADRTVPQGSGAGNSAQQQAQPQTPPLGAHTPSGGGTLPQLPSDGSDAILAGSAPNAGLGVPAVLAIVLLSVVTAALVRAFITQRRTVLG